MAFVCRWQTIFGFRGDELSVLQPNVHWWPCAYCYEESFCLAHAINCPFDQQSDMASLFEPMMSAIAPAADEGPPPSIPTSK